MDFEKELERRLTDNPEYVRELIEKSLTHLDDYVKKAKIESNDRMWDAFQKILYFLPSSKTFNKMGNYVKGEILLDALYSLIPDINRASSGNIEKMKEIFFECLNDGFELVYHRDFIGRTRGLDCLKWVEDLYRYMSDKKSNGGRK